tara:strand:- start:205 stop:669 length:465 start_codon:yes stop_codon:yes gene_type:complete
VRAGLLLAALTLGACGDAAPPARDLEVGTGEAAFEAVVDGQEVPLIFGPQGGHHVWVSFRGADAPAGDALLDLDVVPLGEVDPPPRSAPVRVRPSPAATGWEYIGWPAILPDASCFVGVPLSIEATLTFADGSVGSDTMVVVPAEGAPGLGPCP